MRVGLRHFHENQAIHDDRQNLSNISVVIPSFERLWQRPWEIDFYFIFIIYSVFVLCLLAEASIGIALIRLCPEITTNAKFILRSLKTRLIKVWFWSLNGNLANGIYGPEE